MKKYFITFKRFHETYKSPLKTKANAIMNYIMQLHNTGYSVSELKICKQLKNGKIIDMTTSINKFLRG